MSFVTTRVQSPNENNFKKLGWCLHYLHDTKYLTLTFEDHDMATIKWWVNASFAVHHDYKSHTGTTITLGHGSIVSLSNKQKGNTHSLMEAELVGVNDAMSLVLWVWCFLQTQGFDKTDNVIFQDNQSTMLLVNNG